MFFGNILFIGYLWEGSFIETGTFFGGFAYFVGCVIFSFVAIFMIYAVVFSIILSLVKNKYETSVSYQEKCEICSLDDLYKTQGQFVLGTSVDWKGNKGYYYVRKDEEGNCMVDHEEESDGHRVEIIKTDYDRPKIKYVYEVSNLSEKYELLIGKFEQKRKIKTIIIIPTNTIMTEYNS